MKTQNNATAVARKKQFISEGYKPIWQGEKRKAKEQFIKLIGFSSIRSTDLNGIVTIYVKP